MAQCTAKAKSTQKRCTRKAMIGTTVCQVHGGPAAIKNRGTSSPSYKHGRYSKYLPKNLAQTYREVETDADILETRDSILLVDTLLADALARINDENGYSEKLWGQVRDAVQKLEKAIVTEDDRKLEEVQIELRDLANDGLRQSLTRIEVRQLVQERSKLTEREMKRQVAMRTVMTAEQALLLVASVKAMLRETITDQAQREVISRRFAAIEGAVIDTSSRVKGDDQ